MKRKDNFWSDIKRLNSSGPSSASPVVDGICGNSNIANLFASKLNKHSSTPCSSLLSSVQLSLTASDIGSVCILEEHVAEAISQLKPHKSDTSGITSEHLKYALSVVAYPLASLFTAIIRHGYMPECFRDSVIVPIPKGLQTAQTTVLLLFPLVSVRSWRELSSPSMDHTLQLVPFSLVLNRVIQLHCAPLL